MRGRLARAPSNRSGYSHKNRHTAKCSATGLEAQGAQRAGAPKPHGCGYMDKLRLAVDKPLRGVAHRKPDLAHIPTAKTILKKNREKTKTEHTRNAAWRGWAVLGLDCACLSRRRVCAIAPPREYRKGVAAGDRHSEAATAHRTWHCGREGSAALRYLRANGDQEELHQGERRSGRAALDCARHDLVRGLTAWQ